MDSPAHGAGRAGSTLGPRRMLMLMVCCSAFVAGLMAFVRLRALLREGDRQRALDALVRERVQSVN